MHARAYWIARPWQRHRIIPREMCARPTGEQVDVIRETDRLFEVVGDEQHGDALALDQRCDVLNDARAHNSVERGEGLVHQEQLRLSRQHLRERDALSLAAAEMPWEAMPEAGE